MFLKFEFQGIYFRWIYRLTCLVGKKYFYQTKEKIKFFLHLFQIHLLTLLNKDDLMPPMQLIFFKDQKQEVLKGDQEHLAQLMESNMIMVFIF